MSILCGRGCIFLTSGRDAFEGARDAVLEATWSQHGRQDSSWSRFGAVLESSWGHLVASWGLLGALGVILRPS